MAEDFRNQHIDFGNERYQTVRPVACMNSAARSPDLFWQGCMRSTNGACLGLLQVRELGRGNFGVTMLMQDLQTSEYVAAKFIQRGAKVGACAMPLHCSVLTWPSQASVPQLFLPMVSQINVNVERELLNHRPLLHAHIIRFREVRACCFGIISVLHGPRGTADYSGAKGQGTQERCSYSTITLPWPISAGFRPQTAPMAEGAHTVRAGVSNHHAHRNCDGVRLGRRALRVREAVRAAV